MGLAALLDVELDVGVTLLQPREQRLDARPVDAREHGERLAAVVEQALDDHASATSSKSSPHATASPSARPS